MPTITPLPDPPTRTDPTNFAARADAFLAAMRTMVDEFNVAAFGSAAEFAAQLASTANALDGDARLGIKRTITSSVATTQHLWHERQPYNIAVEGGCTGDDSADNTVPMAAILVALALLPVSARPAVYVPFGTFQMAGIDIPSDVTIFGQGHGCVLKQKANAGRAFIQSADTTNGSHRITLRDLCIDGNKANQPNNSSGYASHGIAIEGPCENWVLRGLKVISTKGHGTQIRGGGPGGLTTCTNGVEISGCWYKDCGNFDVGGTNGRESVYANQAQNLIITGNLMEGSGRQTIALEGSTTNSAIASRKVVVANNILRGALGGGGIDDEANTGGDLIFANNVIYDMTGTAIRTVGDTGRKIVAHNVAFNILSRGFDLESQAGFAGASLHVLGNILHTTGTEAMNIIGGVGTLVGENTIIAAGTVAINFRTQVATETGGRILNNWINGSGQEAIVIDRPCTAPHVRGNVIVDAGSAAFPSAAISIRGNTGFIESPNIGDNTVIETRGTPYTTYAYSFSQLNKPYMHGNGVHGTTATNDVLWSGTASTNVLLGVNNWDPARVTGAPGGYKDGYVGAQIFQGRIAHLRQTVTYSASMTPDAALGNYFRITATNNTAFTINAPANPLDGQPITITIRNASGGALGAATWSGVFKFSAWTNPASGFSRSITFMYDGTNWIETGRTPADVPN